VTATIAAFFKQGREKAGGFVGLGVEPEEGVDFSAAIDISFRVSAWQGMDCVCSDRGMEIELFSYTWMMHSGETIHGALRCASLEAPTGLVWNTLWVRARVAGAPAPVCDPFRRLGSTFSRCFRGKVISGSPGDGQLWHLAFRAATYADFTIRAGRTASTRGLVSVQDHEISHSIYFFRSRRSSDGDHQLRPPERGEGVEGQMRHDPPYVAYCSFAIRPFEPRKVRLSANGANGTMERCTIFFESWHPYAHELHLDFPPTDG